MSTIATNNWSWQRYGLAPSLLLATVAILAEYSGLDLWLSTIIYDFSGSQWRYKTHWITEGLIHQGGRSLVAIIFIFTATFFIASFFVKTLRPWRRASSYVISSALLSALLVSALKSISNIDCPWGLDLYGGDRPYLLLFETRPDSLAKAKCFPAGHASGAYAWLGAFFLAKWHVGRHQYTTLSLVVITGVIFGIAQQIRGAHFLSHDLWTIAICCAVTSSLFSVFFTSKKELSLE